MFLIYSVSASCVRNMHKNVTFVIGKLIFGHISLFLGAFNLRPKKPFGQCDVATSYTCTIYLTGVGVGNRVVQAKEDI